MVQEALKERSADDIFVMACPDCGKWSYYNQGSHFSCRFCERGFYVLGDDESAEDKAVPCIHAENACTLADTIDAGEP